LEYKISLPSQSIKHISRNLQTYHFRVPLVFFSAKGTKAIQLLSYFSFYPLSPWHFACISF